MSDASLTKNVHKKCTKNELSLLDWRKNVNGTHDIHLGPLFSQSLGDTSYCVQLFLHFFNESSIFLFRLCDPPSF